MKSDFILNCDANISLNEANNTLLKHYFYSRFSVPKNTFAQMRKENKNVINSDLIRQFRKARKVIGLFVKWGDEIPETVPDNIKQELDMQLFDEKLAEKIKEKFLIRPMWTKHALISMLKCSINDLKYTLPLFAYFYENGPFRNLWVRYGYNPKKDKTSKLYQMIEVRSRMSTNSTMQYKISVFDDNNMAHRSNPFKYEDNNDVVNTSNNDLEPNYVFRPGQISIFKRTGYQLCDIKMDDVQQIIHENDDNEIECNEKDGWCSKGAIDRIRSIMNAVINNMMNDPEIVSRLEKHETSDNIEICEIYDDFMDYDDINNMLEDTIIEYNVDEK